MRTLEAFLLIACVAAASPTSPAVAQQAPASSAKPVIAAAPLEAMTAKARELYADGLKAFQKQKWPQAYAAFLGAWALQKHYAIAGNLAATEMQLGHHRDAAEHVTIYVRGITQDAKKTPAERETAKLLLDVAAAKVVTVTVSVNVAGADVWMDGARIGAAPLEDPIFVEAGKHEVEVRLDDYVTQRHKVEGVPGDKRPLSITLVKRVDVVPAASATAVPSATATSTATAPPPPRSMVPGLVLGGASAVSLIVGGVLVGIAESTRSELEEGPKKADGSPLCTKTAPGGPDLDPACAKLRALAADRATFGNAGIGLFVAGGLAAAGAAAWFLWPQASATSHRVAKVVPVIGTTGAGLLWLGSF